MNADIIAAELSPQHPEQVAMRAARLMLQRIREEVTEGESFAFENTLAKRSYAHSIREWQAAGYHVALWFLALPSAEAALARVAGWAQYPEEVVRTPGCCTTNSETVPVLLDWGEKR